MTRLDKPEESEADDDYNDEDRNCGGEPCTDYEKEDSTLDEDVQYCDGQDAPQYPDSYYDRYDLEDE